MSPLARLRQETSSPALRIGLGLVALMTCILLLLDAGMSALSGKLNVAREVRQRTSENIALQLTVLIQQGNTRALGMVMEHIAARDPDVLSLGVRKQYGGLLAGTAEHEKHWQQTSSRTSTLGQVVVPVLVAQQRWGQIEISYKAFEWDTITGWLSDTPMQFIAAFFVFGGLACVLFLRRVLVHLDPRSVVPGRVRNAYDTLTEGVAILDQRERIVLANNAFRGLHPSASEELHGKRIEELPWLKPALADLPVAPWQRATQEDATVRGEALDIPQPDGSVRKVVVNCSAIRDNGNRLKGMLVTFDDHSALEAANAKLRAAIADLESSREQVRQQNIRLHAMATRDPLTGCLNRRAFFKSAESIFAQAKRDNIPLALIMTDIDHFKSFNDKYGHRVGDQVLRAFAHHMVTVLRKEALVARYGGEEFCILLPEHTREVGMIVAERLRSQIELHAGQELGLQITASFGLASATPLQETLGDLIESADQALYQAKKTGRNKVCMPPLTAVPDTGTPEAAQPVKR